MKKKLMLNLLCCLTALSAGAASYTVDFNNAIETSDPSFKVSPGWKHIEDKGIYTTQKPTYEYTATGGQDNTGALKAGPQTFSSEWTGETVIYDLLVTPAVSGNISIDVKKATQSGNIKFYKVTSSNGQLARGSEIVIEDPGLVTMFYTTVNIPGITENTMIGIRAEDVYIDNFIADNVDLQLEKALSITSVSATKTGEIDCNDRNIFEISGTVKIKNTGDVDINANEAKFYLTLMKPEGSNYVVDRNIESFTISDAIPAGSESAALSFTAQVNEADIEALEGNDNKARRYDITCDNAPGSKILGNITPIPYKPVPSYAVANNSSLQNNDAINFGIVSGSGQQKLTVSNNGAAEMVINSIEITGDGFACTPSQDIHIAKHEQAEITLTLTSDNYGEKNGTVTIKAAGLDDITFALTGDVLDPSVWYVDFEDGSFPSNMIPAEGWKVDNSLAISPNKYYAVSTVLTNSPMLISPKLIVNNGDVLKIDAARIGTSDSFINIYTSTDRNNWNLIRTLSSDAENDADRFSSEYSGVAWGANTKYLFTTFSLDNLPEGEIYIAFESGNARLDNIFGLHLVEVEHDLFITDINAPNKGMVNYPYTLTASLKNLLDNEETSDSYTATLMCEGEILAEAEPVNLPGGGTEIFTFSFTPHAEGFMNLTVVFEGEDFQIESNPIEINIIEESSFKEIQVGNVTETETGKTSPIDPYYKKSQSETIYTAEQIGLEPGTKITRLLYKAKSSRKTTENADFKVWIENTEDDAPANVLLDEDATARMTNVYDGNYTFNFDTEKTDLIIVDFEEPFVYDGNNLRIAMSMEFSIFLTTYFELDKNATGQSVLRHSDNTLPDSFTASQTPVVYMQTIVDPYELTGKVMDIDENPVENVEITLVSGDVIYSGTSDVDGNYSIRVIQSNLNYTLIASAKGYETFETEIELTEAKTQYNIELTPKAPVTYVLYGMVSDSEGNAIEGAVLTLTGEETHYDATTDMEGNYVISEILEEESEFTLTVTAEGFKSFETTIVFEDEQTLYNVTLTADTPDGIDNINIEEENDIYYDINGHILNGKPSKGFYIHNGKVKIAR